MRMVGRHPACKKTDRRVLVICLEWGADLHMIQLMPLHPKTSSSLAWFKSRLVLPFWYRLTRVVPDKLLAAENRDKGDDLWLNAHVVCSTDSYLCLLCLLCKISSCRPWCSGSTLGRRLSLERWWRGQTRARLALPPWTRALLRPQHSFSQVCQDSETEWVAATGSTSSVFVAGLSTYF